ncbi:PepSY-like domain-containing protein [Fibrella aquatilis]|uniref:PepSY-like domain-containing protein n=1 Tax=Fibrella aquatilis TaxID=2817059 RepID=A0A939JX04_9BACT|nr:PepSY-like domain-containing protein [Fibrella aquatilis]MBO0930534.1 PepSY-like domain-containing protein [Fibrella aquatilis]
MKKLQVVSFIALFGMALWGCNQGSNVAPDATLSTARLTSDSTGFHCRDSLTKVAVTALPATITAYIAKTYAGSTADYAAKDDKGNFLVAISTTTTRNLLLFNADGTFNKELTLRGGPGGHGPGGFGKKRDSLTVVAISALPAAITTYITANYAGATVDVAAKDANRGYVVMITQNGQRKALLFNLDGTFSQEVVRGVKGNYSVVAASTLPANVTTYITTNYAGSSIKLVGKSTTGQYKVFIQTATGQLVELSFAADGTFVQARAGRKW